MKGFLRKVVLFSVILFSFIFLTEILLRNTEYGQENSKSYLDENAKNIELLALGNSLVWSGVNPAFFDYNGYNAANNGQNYKISLELLEKYFDDFDKLKYVITQIDYEYLIRPLKPHYLYTIYYGLKSDRLGDYFIFANMPIQNAFIRIIDFYILKKKYRHGEDQPLGNHLTPYIADINDLKRTYIGEESFIDTDETRMLIYENQKMLSKLIDRLTEKNIKLILISTPMHPIRRDWLNINYHDIVHNTVEDLQNKYPDLIYLDFLYDLDFNENDFSDAHHINQFGSEKLSRKIAELFSNYEL